MRSSSHLFSFVSIAFFVIFCFPFQSVAEDLSQVVYRIGVLAYKGKDEAKKRWGAHEDFLNKRLTPLQFKIVPLSYEKDELTLAVTSHQIDFVITNPGHYTELELGGFISRLTTRRMSGVHGALDQFGGTAITLPDRGDINTYADLSGKRILIPSTSSLGGWQVHLREAMTQGVDLREDSLVTELKNHKKVVQAIIDGQADVGFVRSDLIEELVAEGALHFDQLKIINRQDKSNYPYLLSTRLYPEWPCATVNGTSREIAVKVLRALLDMSPTTNAATTAGIFGWTIPGHYGSVGELFRETGLGPYAITEPFTLGKVIQNYWKELLLLTILFSLVLLISTFLTIKSNRTLRQEIIERKKVEEERDWLISAIEQVTETILITDDKGVIQYVNPAFEKITGYSQHEALGENPRILKSGEQKDKLYLDMWKIISSGETWHGNIVNKKKDGTLYTEEASISPVQDGFGNITNYVAVKRDITDEVEMEKQLYRAQKMEAIGLMAGGVAHDLNNILSGIIGYPELLLHKLEKESELREPIEAILESGQRATTVVADLLTVARGAASIREAHNLNDLIQQYLNSPECNKQLSLYPHILYQNEFMAKRPVVSCSPVHVKKCIMNLTINAAEAMNGTGTITVSTYNQPVDYAMADQQEMEAGEYVVISVRDTGSGIASSDLEHIFEPFYTKKKMGRSGTGLGLTIVWSTMEDHGGKVFVDNSGEGTCFLLYFPVSKEEKCFQSENEKITKFTGKNEHILIVDDEPHLREIASQMLLTMGYTTDSVCSGELAIKFLKETPADLVILDMQMEPGMNGRQTYKEILKLYPSQKAIIASGFSESNDVEATLKLGAGGFVKKPYSMNQLGQAVKEALSS